MEARINEKFADGLSVLERKIARRLKLSVKNGSASEKGEEDVSVKAGPEGEDEAEFSEVGSLAGFGDAPSIAADDPKATALEKRNPELDNVAEESKAPESKENQTGDTLKPSLSDDRISALEVKVEERLNSLEAKMDAKLGVLISLLQRLVPPPES